MVQYHLGNENYKDADWLELSAGHEFTHVYSAVDSKGVCEQVQRLEIAVLGPAWLEFKVTNTAGVVTEHTYSGSYRIQWAPAPNLEDTP